MSAGERRDMRQRRENDSTVLYGMSGEIGRWFSNYGACANGGTGPKSL